MSKIPTRSEVDPCFTWNLSDLYPTDDAWKEAYTAAKESPQRLSDYEGHLSDNPGTLLDFLRYSDNLSETLDRLGNYAQRKSDEDTRNAVYQEMSALFINLAIEVNRAAAFSTPEILAIPDDVLQNYYTAEPALEHYRLLIDRVRRMREHTLSP